MKIAAVAHHGLAVVQPMQHIRRETVPKKAIRTTPMPTPNRRTPCCSSNASAIEASKASAKHSCNSARVTEGCSLIAANTKQACPHETLPKSNVTTVMARASCLSTPVATADVPPH
eukprot:16126-Heterococcus_DN1.PRE.2